MSEIKKKNDDYEPESDKGNNNVVTESQIVKKQEFTRE